MGTTVTNKNGIEFDIDALATDVNGKADKDLVNVSSNASVCIESWHEGTEWYRVYSDGWCEQGGFSFASSTNNDNVTFLKPFINTNYYANCSNYNNTSDYAYHSIVSKRVDGMVIHHRGTAMWEAKGYIR